MKSLHAATPSWSKMLLCSVLSVPHSTLYYRSTKRDEMPVKEAIDAVAGAWPRYGSQRIAAQMKREGVTFHDKSIGERRTRRVMREIGLLAKPRPRKVRTTNSNHAFPRFENLVKGLSVVRPNHVWVSDITYIALGSGFVYLAVIMDVFTRSIRGWFLSRRLDGDLTLVALKQAMETATPEIHHSDQGGQYAATEYVALLQSQGVLVSMASVGCPEENGFAERLMRTIKEEHVSPTEYQNINQARTQIGQFLTMCTKPSASTRLWAT